MITRRRRTLKKPRPAGTLKEAMADLVEACGGTTRVADLLTLSQSTVQRYTDQTALGDELKLSHVRQLEATCGDPIVTRFLAAEARHAVVPLQVAEGASLPADMAKYGATSHKLFERFAQALADGQIDAREAAKIKSQSIRVMSALATILAECDARMQGD